MCWGPTALSKPKVQAHHQVSPLGRAAFLQFAIERLLDPEQRDLVAFARDRGAPIEVVNLLQAAI